MRTLLKLTVLAVLMIVINVGTTLMIFGPPASEAHDDDCVTGDVNGDGEVTILDPIHTLQYLFTNGPGLVECAEPSVPGFSIGIEDSVIADRDGVIEFNLEYHDPDDLYDVETGTATLSSGVWIVGVDCVGAYGADIAPAMLNIDGEAYKAVWLDWSGDGCFSALVRLDEESELTITNIAQGSATRTFYGEDDDEDTPYEREVEIWAVRIGA